MKNKIDRTLILVFALCAASHVVWSQPLYHSTTVWNQSEEDIFTYFVYGLAVTNKGTILSFAEARISDASDHGAHHIVLKRSIDNGKTFSSSTILKKSIDGESWANPTPVVEKNTGKIFLFYALNHDNRSSKVFYMVSEDDGISWSSSVEITSLFEKNNWQWTFHLPGPGHGIQLKNGRLIVPIWHRRGITFPRNERAYGVNVIYSDDHGGSWYTGEETPVGMLNESQLIERKDGDLILISRTIKGQNGVHQMKLISRDKGMSWSKEPQYAKGLKGTVCDIGMIRHNKHPNVVLVSQPSHVSSRSDLVIRMSTDQGRNWQTTRLLQKGNASYSDLAVLPDGTIICLFGKGGGPTSPQTVNLVRFNLKWLQKKDMF